VRTLATALAYFTILPLRLQREDAAPSAAIFGYLPFVGLLIGGSAGAAAYGIDRVGAGALTVPIAFGIPIAFTGALHVDGFLDSCDALLVCATPQRRLEIMKDPHHGTFAVAYFAVLCAVWVAALTAFPPFKLVAVLAYACAAARWAAILNGFRFPYSRGGRPGALAAVLGGLAVVGAASAVGGSAWIATPAVAIASLAAGSWAARRLGGVLVGDVYGALIVCGEVGVLVVCAMVVGR
jgi:adenosylcobinamide-GDP ribazoletransferase